MKIAFFWTHDFSTAVLASIITKPDIEVKLIVSQPDKPVWRKKEILPTPLKEFWLKNNIEVLQPETLKNNTDFENKLKSLDLDFIIVVAYWKIIPVSILDIPKYYSINVHGSLLPKYRWASPIQESIKNWDEKTWVSIMEMTAWMDEWWVFETLDIEIDFLDKTPDLFKKFESVSWNLLYKTLKSILDKNIKPIAQDDLSATYCSKISKQDWEINFNLDWLEIFNKYKAFYPWPWIYTYFNWKKLDLCDVLFERNDSCLDDDFSIWDVVEYEDHWKTQIAILVKSWLLILKEVKLEWKKQTDIFSFINWNKNFLDYNFTN